MCRTTLHDFHGLQDGKLAKKTKVGPEDSKLHG